MARRPPVVTYPPAAAPCSVANRLRQLEARAAQEARRRDTCRKIILGGLLLDAAGKEPRFAGLLNALVARVQRTQDRAVFAEWSRDGRVTRAADRSADRG